LPAIQGARNERKKNELKEFDGGALLYSDSAGFLILHRANANGSSSDSEAPTKHNSQVWVLAACRLCLWRRAEKSSPGEYRIDRLDQMTHGLRLQDVPLRPSLTYFDRQPLGVMSGKN
jgi:hypothetical protein